MAIFRSSRLLVHANAGPGLAFFRRGANGNAVEPGKSTPLSSIVEFAHGAALTGGVEDMARRPRPLVAGNWKMNGLMADLAEIQAMRDAVEAGGAGHADVLICPPATMIAAAALIARGSALKIGGQTCRSETCGAYTGDVSAVMLRDAGAGYVILGHSERRANYGETNAAVRARAISVLEAGLSAIICVGETRSERDAGRAFAVVGRQLLGSIPAHPDSERLVIAYEPIWAIGTGITPTSGDVASMHRFIRGEVERLVPQGGSQIRLLYGGSVRSRNARELMGVPDVDGALIGGASLDVDDFMGIAGVYRQDVTNEDRKRDDIKAVASG